MKGAPRNPASAMLARPWLESVANPTHIPSPVGDIATPAPFDATDERFIDLLVDEALKTWRTRIS